MAAALMRWQACDDHDGEEFVPENVLPQLCRQCRLRAIRHSAAIRQAGGQTIRGSGGVAVFDRRLTRDEIAKLMETA